MHRSRYPEPILPAVDLPGYVLASAPELGERPALVDGATGETMSYGGLAEAVAVVSRELGRAGVGAGTPVGLAAVNQPAWVVASYAVLSAGGSVVPLNPTFTAGEIAKLLDLAGCSLVVTDGQARPAASEAITRRGGRLLDLLDLVTAGRFGAPAVVPDPEAMAVIAFSSGTTGLPKGVQLSHRNLVATLVQHEGIYHVGPDDTVVAALPLFHIYGMSIILGYALRHGATVVTLPRFDLERYLAVIAEWRVTWLHVAPPLALALLSEATAAADLSSVRHVVSGAAPLDPSVADRLAARIGCPVGQGYGMTEASPGVTWVPDDGSVACPAGSVGVLVAGTEARLVDPASGTDTDGPGELWVRGPQIMQGYLGAPESTAATVVEGGWMRTGDILRVDDDGVWWVVDRLKELIKYKGWQVAPAELEGMLLDHPAVADAGVTGVPDDIAGELPVAWVAARGAVTEAELLAWVAERVAPYKRLRAVHFVETLPRSPSGKILRRQLRQLTGP